MVPWRRQVVALAASPAWVMDGKSTFARILSGLTGANDGELSFRLQHPRHHVEKEYEVVVRGKPSEEVLDKLRGGVQLDEGRTAPSTVKLLGGGPDAGTTRLRVVLRQGWKRQIRRSLQVLGHRVVDLRRVRIGPLRLGELTEGGARELRRAEVDALRHAVGL